MKKFKFISFLFLMIMSLGILCSCSGEQGPTGPQGEKGDTGAQGPQGEQGIQGEDGHSPEITIGDNGNWYIDGADTGVSTEGEKGKSAYETFKEYYPDYRGTEKDWINDVAMGNKCNLFGHEWDEGVVTTPAQEGVDGKKTYTCGICNEYKYEVIPMIKVYADAEIYEINGVEYVNYGSYPQTHVGDELLIAELNKLTETNDRGYYEYNGKEYAKIFTNPYDNNFSMKLHGTTSSIDKYGNVQYYTYKYSDGTTINANVVEWFIVEPIQWIIISKNADGSYQLYSEYILDDTSYCDYRYVRSIDGVDVYQNNYKYSNIRAWLNGYDGTDYKITDYTNKGFYNLAFKDIEKRAILTKEIDNGANTIDPSMNLTACDNTYDKIYLLSYKDINNSNYGFSDDTLKCTKVTDYAKAVGAWWSTSSEYFGNGCYWLRSPYGNGSAAYCVSSDGEVYYCSYYSHGILVDHTYGARVACTINLDVTESGKDPGNEDYKNLISEIKKDVKNQGVYDEGKYNFIFSIDTSENYMYTGIIEYDPSSDELSIYYASLKNDESGGSSVTIYIPNGYNSDYLFDYKYVSPTVNNEGVGKFYAPTFTSSSSVDFSLHSGDWSEYVSSTYCALLISMALDNFANSSTYDMSVLGFNNYNY